MTDRRVVSRDRRRLAFRRKSLGVCVKPVPRDDTPLRIDKFKIVKPRRARIFRRTQQNGEFRVVFAKCQRPLEPRPSLHAIHARAFALVAHPAAVHASALIEVERVDEIAVLQDIRIAQARHV